MLVSMLTAMYMMVRVVESIAVQFTPRKEPLPYMVNQPLPWQVHSVSPNRRSSRPEEFQGLRRNSMGVFRKNSDSCNGTCGSPTEPPLSPVEVEKAAATIQSHFRKLQQKKQKNGK